MQLTKMTVQEFNKYLNLAIPEYAKEKIKAGTWKEAEAIELAKDSYQTLLPHGVHTPHHFLFSITLNSTQIGMLWIKATDNQIFIYDFIINKAYRGKGYGKNSLALLELWAKEHHFVEIGLHVFAHNESAYRLYKKMGYIETDITMHRKINN